MLDGREFVWRLHVAMALPVLTEDGSVRDVVFDPGIFDGPVFAEDWGAAIRARAPWPEVLPLGTVPQQWHQQCNWEPELSSEKDALSFAFMAKYIGRPDDPDGRRSGAFRRLFKKDACCGYSA